SDTSDRFISGEIADQRHDEVSLFEVLNNLEILFRREITLRNSWQIVAGHGLRIGEIFVSGSLQRIRTGCTKNVQEICDPGLIRLGKRKFMSDSKTNDDSFCRFGEKVGVRRNRLERFEQAFDAAVRIDERLTRPRKQAR